MFSGSLLQSGWAAAQLQASLPGQMTLFDKDNEVHEGTSADSGVQKLFETVLTYMVTRSGISKSSGTLADPTVFEAQEADEHDS